MNRRVNPKHIDGGDLSAHWRSQRRYSLDGYLLLEGREKEGWPCLRLARPVKVDYCVERDAPIA
jgi:hypothetical protein